MRFVILFLLCTPLLMAQNLVKNPSFENSDFCPTTHGDFNNNVTFWSTPTNGTSDYYSRCSARFGDMNPHGIQKPHHKKAYAGIVTYYENKHNTLPNYREYLQGELKTPLTKWTYYTIIARISLADKANYAVNELSVVLLENALQLNHEVNINLNNLKAKNVTFTHLPFLYKPGFRVKDNWMTLEKTFKASGFETYLCIGNFNSDIKTKKIKVSKSFLPLESYYYIDNISITPIKTKSYKTKTKYTFKTLLFNFNEAHLIKNAITELDKLYNQLQNKPKLTIEIYGHTDDIGTIKRNNELSLQRAKAVATYLIKKGLNSSRIKWFGFGAKFPLTKNNSTSNRTLNRRVEFKLFNQ